MLPNFVINFVILWNDVTQSQTMLDANVIGESSHKENVSLVYDVNYDGGCDKYFSEHLSLLR